MKIQFARKFSVLIAIAALQTGCAANVGSVKVDDVGSYLKLEKHVQPSTTYSSSLANPRA